MVNFLTSNSTTTDFIFIAKSIILDPISSMIQNHKNKKDHNSANKSSKKSRKSRKNLKMNYWIKTNEKTTAERSGSGMKKVNRNSRKIPKNKTARKKENKKQPNNFSPHLTLNSSSTKDRNSSKALKSRSPTWVTPVGSITTLPLKSKPDSIEVLKFWLGQNIIWVLICGLWLAWRLKCWQESCFSTPEKIIHKLLERMTII